MKLFQLKLFGFLLLMVCGYSTNAQQQETLNLKPQVQMKTFLIEREIPNAGQLTAQDLKAISRTSCNVLKEMDANTIQWLHSYVTENKVYCVYKATGKEQIKQHAKKGGFPANVITELTTTISPKTAVESN